MLFVEKWFYLHSSLISVRIHLIASVSQDSEGFLLQEGADFLCGAGDQPGGDGRTATVFPKSSEFQNSA